MPIEIAAVAALISAITTALTGMKTLFSSAKTQVKPEDATAIEKYIEELEKRIADLGSLARMIQAYQALHIDARSLEEGANSAIKTMLTAQDKAEVFAPSAYAEVAGRFSKGIESSFRAAAMDIDPTDKGAIDVYVSQLTAAFGRAEGSVDSKDSEALKAELYKIGDVAAKLLGLTRSRVEFLLRELERLSLRG